VTLESVADFIERRVAKKIGAKHYMALARQASKFYPRYAKCARAENRQDETKHCNTITAKTATARAPNQQFSPKNICPC